MLTNFRAAFVGKASPVQLFWGAVDLACTRFSGRPAPVHPGGAPNCPNWVMAEGYSCELSSSGFWPGGGKEGAFYSYAYPEPDGFRAHPVEPDTATSAKNPTNSCWPGSRAVVARDTELDSALSLWPMTSV